MANEAQTQNPTETPEPSAEEIAAAFPAFETERGGVKLPVAPAVQTRGKNKNSIIPKAQRELTGPELASFFGDENLVFILNRVLNKALQTLQDEATDAETNVFDYEKFQRLVAEFSLVRETMAVLNARFDELFARASKLDASKPENQAEFLKLFKQMQDVRAARDSKKKRPSDEDATGEE